jgi:hypothetical protein
MNFGGGIMLGTGGPADNNEIIITQGKARQSKYFSHHWAR